MLKVITAPAGAFLLAQCRAHYINTDIAEEAFKIVRQRLPSQEIVKIVPARRRATVTGSQAGTAWTAFLRAPNGRDETVPITALDKLAAIALVRRKFPQHTLIGVKLA